MCLDLLLCHGPFAYPVGFPSCAQPHQPSARTPTCSPFAFQLMSALAEAGQLQPLVERAKEAHAAKVEERRRQQQS